MEPPEYGSEGGSGGQAASAAEPVDLDLEAKGLDAALATVCALEARLRSAVQASVPISRSLELDPNAADREREALLSAR